MQPEIEGLDVANYKQKVTWELRRYYDEKEVWVLACLLKRQGSAHKTFQDLLLEFHVLPVYVIVPLCLLYLVILLLARNKDLRKY